MCLLYARHHTKGFLVIKSHLIFGIALWERYYHHHTILLT